MTATPDPTPGLLAAGFDRAVAASPDELVEREYVVAGHPVLVRVVGNALAARALAPWAHLRQPGACFGEPALVAELWDERASGITFDGDTGAPGVHLGTPGGRIVVQAAPGSLSALDRETQRVVGWRRSASALPIEEHWRVLPSLLALWCIDRGINVVHAGLVADGDDGILLAGPGGVGKSTTTLACVAAGMMLLGDDQVALGERAGWFEAHSLYATARVTTQTLERYPELALGGAVTEPGDGKALLFAGDDTRVARSARVRAIVLPRLTAGRAALTDATAGEALLALAPTSLINAVGGGRWALERLARLVAAVPLVRLDVGESPHDAAALVRRALDAARDMKAPRATDP